MKKVCKGFYEYKGFTVMHDGGNGQWSVRDNNSDDYFADTLWFDTKSECKNYIDLQ